VRLRFEPDGHDTCVKVDASYRVLDGSMADAIAALMTPRRAHELEADVRRLGPYLDVLLTNPDAMPLDA
jgi:uncharacterized membrane protein